MMGALLVVLALLAGCAAPVGEPSREPSASGAMARIQSRGELVVGTAGSMPPFNMTTKRGEVIGLDVDLARSMAEGLHVKLRLAAMAFPELLPALQAGKVDAVISAMTITPERSLQATFVGPYFVSGKSYLTKADGPVAGKGTAELNDPTIRLAALSASTSQRFVEQTMPKARLVLVRDYDAGIQLVLQDRVDAMVADFPVCVFSVFRYPDRGLYALVAPLTREEIGIALPKGDVALEAWTRRWLQGLEASGALGRMQDRWFKNPSWLGELP